MTVERRQGVISRNNGFLDFYLAFVLFVVFY